MSQKTLGCLIV